MSASILERAVHKLGVDGVIAALPEAARARLPYEWRAWARPEQLPPEHDWRCWLILAGRGFGKTRTGAEWVREFAFNHPGCLIAMIARTAADVRTTMLEGPSGLLSISPPWFTPEHEPSKCKITWPNGSIALHFSAEEPRGLRGPQFHAAWCDEIAAWPMVDLEDGEKGIPNAWTQLQYGMRMPGIRPQIVVTTTPRPVKLVKQLIEQIDTVTTRGSTFDNAANLAPEFITSIKEQYEGTRIGRQELYAEVLLDVPGALWNADMIHGSRVSRAPQLHRVVVALDPSGSSHRKSDEAGIVTAGVGFCGCKGNPRDVHGFVLRDDSGVMSPDAWGKETVKAYEATCADKVIGERNYGGDMVESVVRHVSSTLSYEEVVASRGKAVRAAPIAALYEQGKVHHVSHFEKLEDEMTTFDPLTSKFSPGRLDALVFALTHLMVGPGVGNPAGIKSLNNTRYARRDAF
jgi:phage terminase large subunit-like protein